MASFFLIKKRYRRYCFPYRRFVLAFLISICIIMVLQIVFIKSLQWVNRLIPVTTGTSSIYIYDMVDF